MKQNLTRLIVPIILFSFLLSSDNEVKITLAFNAMSGSKYSPLGLGLYKNEENGSHIFVKRFAKIEEQSLLSDPVPICCKYYNRPPESYWGKFSPISHSIEKQTVFSIFLDSSGSRSCLWSNPNQTMLSPSDVILELLPLSGIQILVAIEELDLKNLCEIFSHSEIVLKITNSFANKNTKDLMAALAARFFKELPEYSKIYLNSIGLSQFIYYYDQLDKYDFSQLLRNIRDETLKIELVVALINMENNMENNNFLEFEIATKIFEMSEKRTSLTKLLPEAQDMLKSFIKGKKESVLCSDSPKVFSDYYMNSLYKGFINRKKLYRKDIDNLIKHINEDLEKLSTNINQLEKELEKESAIIRQNQSKQSLIFLSRYADISNIRVRNVIEYLYKNKKYITRHLIAQLLTSLQQNSEMSHSSFYRRISEVDILTLQRNFIKMISESQEKNQDSSV